MRWVHVFFPFYGIGEQETLLDILDGKLIAAQYLILLAGELVFTAFMSSLPISSLFFVVGIVLLYPEGKKLRNLVKKELGDILKDLLADPDLAISIANKARDIALVKKLETRKLSGNTIFVLVLAIPIITVIFANQGLRCLEYGGAIERLACTVFAPENFAARGCPNPLCLAVIVLWSLALLMYVYIYMYAISAVPYLVGMLIVVNNIKTLDIYDLRIGKLFRKLLEKPLDTEGYDLTPILDFYEKLVRVVKPLIKISIIFMVVTLLTVTWYTIVKSFGALLTAIAVAASSLLILVSIAYNISSFLITIKDKARRVVKLVYASAVRAAHLQGLEDVPKTTIRLLDTLENSIDLLRTTPLSIQDIVQLISVIASLAAALAVFLTR